MNENLWVFGYLGKKRVEPQAEKACYYCNVCILTYLIYFVEN
jgi:hypothetical protein